MEEPRVLGHTPREISEEQVAESQPRVRWNQIERYEYLYNVVETHVNAAQELGRPVDPRYLEIGIRILKEEAGLYRLNKPTAAIEDDAATDGGVDRAAVVEAQLKELEARLQGSAPGASAANAQEARLNGTGVTPEPASGATGPDGSVGG